MGLKFQLLKNNLLKTTFFAIGLMSGTSLDGVDLCYVKFNSKNAEHWNYEILQAETIAYTQNWERKLQQAIQLSTEDLLSLNSEYGFFLAELVQTFIRKNSIKELDIIASHGHTVFHQTVS